MALYPLQPGGQPLGQFDFLDTDVSLLVGGMLGTFDEAARTNSASEKAAYDVLDGYVADGSSAATRPILRIADTASETRKVFFLLDDGVAGYGTMFGTLIGNPLGLSTTVASGGSLLGPSTVQGSGKVTAWGAEGLYAVSTDAVEAALSDLTDTPLPGATLYRSTNGKLTSLADTGDKIGVYVEHAGNGSYVTTPAHLVGAAQVLDRIVIHYAGATAFIA